MSGGSSASCFAFLCFDLLWWTRSVCSCLHSSRPPLVFGQLRSSAFPSPHHLLASIHQPVWAWQMPNKVLLYPELFGWDQSLFIQRDQVGLCSFKPHVWPFLCEQRWPGTQCSLGNGIPACYSVHDLPSMQCNLFLLCRFIQTHSFSSVQKGDPSTGGCREENEPFKYCCHYICSCYPGHQVQIQEKMQRSQNLEIWFADL